MRQRDSAPDHLVGLFGVHPQPKGEVNRFVELGPGKLGQEFHGRLEGISPLGVHHFEGFSISFARHIEFIETKS
jgi:hypothetical protein